jgi:hypothetical protein
MAFIWHGVPDEEEVKSAYQEMDCIARCKFCTPLPALQL